MSQTLGALMREATGALRDAGIDSAARDAQFLVAKAADIPADRLAISAHDMAGDGVADRLQSLLAERLKRRPLSHILGRRHFFDHEFAVDGRVLDPRPETETLVTAALEHGFDRVLDLGTGSGAIVISLLAARPQARGVGADLSTDALTVARENGRALGVDGRCDWAQSDWFDRINGAFDLIVSNPPYIARDEMPGLAPELSHEPRMALTDEADGLTAYRRIAAGAGAHLTAGGHIMVEIGPTQARAVSGIFESAGLTTPRVIRDLDGRDRVVVAQNSH